MPEHQFTKGMIVVGTMHEYENLTGVVLKPSPHSPELVRVRFPSKPKGTRVHVIKQGWIRQVPAIDRLSELFNDD